MSGGKPMKPVVVLVSALALAASFIPAAQAQTAAD
jgi:hypothetical protein